LVLQGFSVVDEQRLASLGDADLLGLVRDGYLALIYSHMGSLSNVSRLSERLAARLAPSAETDDIASAESAPAPRKKRGNGVAVRER
jgi:hypothetical protein